MNIYVNYGFKAPLTIHVFVLAEAKDLAISESGNTSLNKGLKVSAAANWMLLSTIAAAILTSAEVPYVNKSEKLNGY